LVDGDMRHALLGTDAVGTNRLTEVPVTRIKIEARKKLEVTPSR